MNPVELAVLAAFDLVVIGAALWLAWVLASGGRPYFKQHQQHFELHLVGHDKVAEFERRGWRVVSELQRSAHGYWSVLMRREL